MRKQKKETPKDTNTDAEVLKWMLGQRFRAVKRKKRLEVRLRSLKDEMKQPVGGQGYDPMPRSGGNNEGAASFTYKIADIEDRIYEQKEVVEKTIVRVMDIIEYLPSDGLEREICECRHIDMKQWAEIQEDIPMSRSQVNKRYNKAIEMLLKNRRVKRMVESNRDAYISWKYEKNMQSVKTAKKKTPTIGDPNV